MLLPLDQLTDGSIGKILADHKARQAFGGIDNVALGAGGFFDPIGHGEHLEASGRHVDSPRRADPGTHFAG
jgi:hypothetical protein